MLNRCIVHIHKPFICEQTRTVVNVQNIQQSEYTAGESFLVDRALFDFLRMGGLGVWG